MDKASILRLTDHLKANLPGQSIAIIETHISWVITTDDFAYKIKKPISYPFLDYTTLAKRKFCCEKEITLNKRLTDDMYLKVVPIYENGDVLTIDGEGDQVFEYAVKMKKQDPAKQMNLLLKKNELHPADMRKIAKVVSQFHLKAQVCNPDFSTHEMKQRFNDIDTVTDFLEKHLSVSDGKLISSAVDMSNDFIDQHESLFNNRISEGYIRDLHGDLHSKNIFLIDEPVIFDCIEFNDSYRQIDVLDEIAFFCMDLEAFGRYDLTDEFLNEYLQAIPAIKSENDEALFLYYKCYRANVRVKVNALRAHQTTNPGDRIKCLAAVERYLALMDSYNHQLRHTIAG